MKKEIQPLYTLRWQIEILFKAWKSIYDINKVKKMKVERFECHLYGTLISLLITSTLAFKIREFLYLKKEKEISEFKAISIIKEFLASLYQALMEGGEAILANIEVMLEQVEKNGQKAKRLKKRTPFEILLGVFEQSNMKAA
ncbi:transposase [Neobacillus drentensis]|nr:transposase [Neobacillus drentensis]